MLDPLANVKYEFLGGAEYCSDFLNTRMIYLISYSVISCFKKTGFYLI